MYEVLNRSGEMLVIKVKQGGNYRYINLISDSSIETEEVTNHIEKYRERGDVRVREVELEEDDSEEEVVLCEAEKSEGGLCENKAKYPEDNPEYCGIHKYKLEDEE